MKFAILFLSFDEKLNFVFLEKLQLLIIYYQYIESFMSFTYIYDMLTLLHLVTIVTQLVQELMLDKRLLEVRLYQC